MKKLILNDKIYGKEVITETVLIDLINSKQIQRLKKINQFGVPDKYYHLKNYSRFEHSIGVMLLLKKLNAAKEEQISGLLHDVSHTAFSHVYDWVVGSGAIENAQDKYHKQFITKELASIFKKHKLNPKKVANYKNFKLLEREIPNICADRIDYNLREMKLSLARDCFKNLTVKDNKIIFKDKKYAKAFAQAFLENQIKHWGALEAVSRYEILSTALKIALKEKIISDNDFWLTDNELLTKVEKAKNDKIKSLLKILTNKSFKKLKKGKTVKHKKFRFVDPEFLKGDKLIKLTKDDLEFKKEILRAKKENKKGTYPIEF